MKKIIFIFLIFICFKAISQENDIEINEYKFVVDSIFSNNIRDYRKIKIYLPENYQENEKYPVIYTLDAEWMFEPIVAQSKILVDFDVIPKTIIVGINHKKRNDDLGINWETGEFTVKSENFYSFLTRELLPKINKTYSTSGFVVLVGHSNSATFCENILTQKAQPFNGFVALSQNLFGNQLQEYIKFSNQSLTKPIFYFVASGKRDATPRLESGMKLDSLFQINSNPQIIPLHKLYDADHSGIVGQGLANGISHIFSEYKHYNDWDDKLIDSLLAKNISSLDFIKHYSQRMKAIYGINFKPNQNDLSLMQAITQNDTDVEAVQKFEIEHFGKSEEFYAIYAQIYEYVKSYEKALDYWNKNIEINKTKNINFFYFRRPLQLLCEKMNQPDRAIVFSNKWKKEIPYLSQEFNYWIAKIALENNIQKKVGLKAIKEYINNYEESSPIDIITAKGIEQNLEK